MNSAYPVILQVIAAGGCAGLAIWHPSPWSIGSVVVTGLLAVRAIVLEVIAARKANS